MTHRHALVLVAFAGLSVACATLAPSRAGRLVVPPDSDETEAAHLVALRARAAEVVYLGEVHDNPRHHTGQARILQAMLEAGARPALAFEMLVEDQQAAADAVVESRDSAMDAEGRLRWRARGWPDFGMYWPLFELARRHGLRVVATDLDPALVRRISRDGLGAVGKDGTRLVSLLAPDGERERALARTIQKAHCDLLPERRLPAMVESWHARNVAIARRIAEALRRAGQVVVIIGRGHQEAGGLPAQLEALRPGTRQLVVEMLEVARGQSPDDVARQGTGEVLWLVPAVERPDPCAGLRQRLQGSHPAFSWARREPGKQDSRAGRAGSRRSRTPGYGFGLASVVRSAFTRWRASAWALASYATVTPRVRHELR
jgi:uncharacterized iron-regulated protein